MTDEATITVVVDNTSEKTGLRIEHGLSFWVQVADKKVLFDTGQGAALATNAFALGADLARTDIIVLSHGHYDHTGGLRHIFNLGVNAPVVAHPDVLRDRYRQNDVLPHKHIGMPHHVRAHLARPSNHFSPVRQPTRILPTAWVTGPIPRIMPFEDTGGSFYDDASCTIPDMVNDDQAMWLETDKGLVVLLGCAHAGVVNTLNYIADVAGTRRFHAVIGGMHLGAASRERLAATMDGLRRYAPSMVASCHCTGAEAQRWLQRALPEAVRRCGAGSTFRF